MKLCLNCLSGFESTSWRCPECSWSPAVDRFPRFAPELARSSEHFPRAAIAELAALEDRYFWFTARNELIAWLISAHFPAARSLLEVGCGTGVVLAHLRNVRPSIGLTGIDLLPEMLEIAQARVPSGTFLQADIRRIPFADEFDLVCALDVIEHVDEDASAVEQMVQTLRPGGGVVIAVPQHPSLWSAWDEFDRHRRRYTRPSLLAILESAGIDVLRATSSVMLLLPLVLASRLRHRRMTDGYDPFRELRLARPVNAAFGAVMRAERFLVRHGVSLPVGSSLVIAGRRRS